MSERMVPLNTLTLIFCSAYSIHSNLSKTTAFFALSTQGLTQERMGAPSPRRGFALASLINLSCLFGKGSDIESLNQMLYGAMEGDEDDRGSGRMAATGRLAQLQQHQYR